MIDNQDELFESLTLERKYVHAVYPDYSNFGSLLGHWFDNGYHGPVHPRHNIRNLKDIEYRNSEGQLHRIYGPAYISLLYNIKAWYKNGKRHREDGPAYIHNDNYAWFYEGQPHCLCGPAISDGGGPHQYWIYGQRMSFKEYKKEINRRKRNHDDKKHK